MEITSNVINPNSCLGSGDSQVSNDPQFMQLSNALWEALKEYNQDPSYLNLQTVISAKAALTTYFASHVPSSSDQPAFAVYNDIELGIGNLYSDLGNVKSYFADQGKTDIQTDISKLLGDIKEYDWYMGLPSGQQDPAILNQILTSLAGAVNQLNTDAKKDGVSDGYLTALLTQLGTPTTSGGVSILTLAENVVGTTPPKQSDLDALSKALQSIGETGNNGGDLRNMIAQAAWEEFSISQ